MTIPIKQPEIGEKWILAADSKDPFPPKHSAPYATILDVKDGWVRYHLNSIFDDNRMNIESFLHCYRYYRN